MNKFSLWLFITSKTPRTGSNSVLKKKQIRYFVVAMSPFILELVSILSILGAVVTIKVNHRFGGSPPKDCNCIMQFFYLKSFNREQIDRSAIPFKRLSGYHQAK